MSQVILDSEILRKLAHSGLKTLGSLVDLLELYEVDTNHGLHDPAIRNAFNRSLRSLAQAIRDLRLIAICDDMASEAPNVLNWKLKIEEIISEKNAKAISFIAEDSDYHGNGYPELLSSAIANLRWFAKRFFKNSIKVHLWVISIEERPWIRMEWDFGNSLKVDSSLSLLEPYYPMFPKESLALDQSTGLALFAANRIAELHGGTLSAQVVQDNLRLIWTCPKSIDVKPNLKRRVN